MHEEEAAMNTSLSQQFITEFGRRSTVKIPSCSTGEIIDRGNFPGENRAARFLREGSALFNGHPNKNSAVFVGRFGSMVRRTMGREFGKLKLLFSGMVVLARGQKILGSGLEGLMTRSVRHVSGYQRTNDATQET